MVRTSRRDLIRLGILGSLAAPVARAEALARKLIVRSARPQDLETPVEALVEEFTPNDLFFVRSHFGAPIIDIPSWRLRVEGMVDRPSELSISDLRKLGVAKRPGVLQCAGNGRGLFRPRVAGAQWERGAVGQALWRGVRLADLLKFVGAQSGARFVTFIPGDHPMAPTVPKFLRSIPIDKAQQDVLLAWEMNGAPLSILHGAPLRAVVPGWAGDHWIKWLRGIRVSDAEDSGFYMQTAYKFPTEPIPPGGKPAKVKTLTAIPVKSLIARPLEGAVLTAGRQVIQGVAFGGAGPITRLEVSDDDGVTWHQARLDSMVAAGAWQRWRYTWQAVPGAHVLRARATDSAGEMQPREPQWNPSGYLYNAWDAVRCEVRA
jgi:sulfite oxidase